MAIKKLQNNFTTPEQSKRLLEMGVPADSADLYTSLGFKNLTWIRNTKNELSEDFFDALINGKSAHIPIWSVGRLIEIIALCGQTYPYKQRWSPNMVQDIVELMEDIIHELNFSNLEEPEV